MSTEAISVSQPAVNVRDSGRLIYVGMAMLFVVVAVTGFLPRSFAIVTGQMPVPRPIVHLHAAAMSAWLALLLAQTVWMKSGRVALHTSLGAVSFAIAPVMFLTMTALVLGQGAFLLDNANTLPPDVRARGLAFTAFIMGRAAILFGLFYVWAVVARK